MIAAARNGVVVLGLVLLAACDSGITTPTPTRTSTPTPTSVVPAEPPPRTELSGPSRTYVYADQIPQKVSPYTLKSRFVLYDNGAFVLEYPSLFDRGYRGKYTITNGEITFQWDDWSSAGAWEATGLLNGTTLKVEYGLIMWLTDFEDAVYVLQQ